MRPSRQPVFDPDAAVAEALAKDDIVVPPYPAVAVRLNRLINSGDYDVNRLTEIVQTDPAVSARVVGISNSSRYRPKAGPITTVTQAVSRLGAAEVAQVAMAAGLGNAATSEGVLEELKYFVWRQSLYTALACKELGPGRQLGGAESFLCGLLVGLGRSVTLACIEKVLGERKDATALSAERWLETVERQQARVGVFIARRWDVPSLFIEVLSSLGRGEPGTTTLGALVHTMTQCFRLLEHTPTPDEPALRALLDSESECQRLLALAPRLPEIIDSLVSERPTPPKRKARKPLASMVLPEPARSHDDLLWLQCPAVIPTKKGEQPVELQRIGLRGAQLLAPQSLRPNWVTRVVVSCPSGQLDLWVNVKTCTPHEGRHLVEVQPFALSGEPARRWADAVQYARAHPPPAPPPGLAGEGQRRAARSNSGHARAPEGGAGDRREPVPPRRPRGT